MSNPKIPSRVTNGVLADLRQSIGNHHALQGRGSTDKALAQTLTAYGRWLLSDPVYEFTVYELSRLKNGPDLRLRLEDWEVLFQVLPGFRDLFCQRLLRFAGNPPHTRRMERDLKWPAVTRLQEWCANLSNPFDIRVPMVDSDQAVLDLWASDTLEQISETKDFTLALSGGQAQYFGCIELLRLWQESRQRSAFSHLSLVALNDMGRSNEDARYNATKIVSGVGWQLGAHSNGTPLPDEPPSVHSHYGNLVREPNMVVLGAGNQDGFVAQLARKHAKRSSKQPDAFDGDYGGIPIRHGRLDESAVPAAAKQQLTQPRLDHWLRLDSQTTVVALIPQVTKVDAAELALRRGWAHRVYIGRELADLLCARLRPQN